MPALPAQGSASWYTHYTAVHAAAAAVTDGRLSDAIMQTRIPVFPSIEGLMLSGFGHSYIDATARNNDNGPGGKYIDRLNGRLRTVLDNNGTSAMHMQDIVLDALGSRDVTKSWTLGERGIAIVDCVTNDAGSFGATAAALNTWEQSFRALLWLLSTDSTAMWDDRDALFTYSAAWTNLANGDYRAGTLKNLAQSTAGTASFTISTPGKYGMSFASLSTGATDMEVVMDGTVLKSFDTSGAIACGHTGPAGTRTFSSMVATFDVPSGTHAMVLRNKTGGVSTAGTLFDYMSRMNTVDPVKIFVPKGVYTNNGVADAVYDAYNARMATVAAEFPNVTVVDTLTGWNKATMIGADLVHPSALGNQFIASKMLPAVLTAYGVTL